MRVNRFAVFLALLLGLSGCGYSFVGGVTNVPPGAETIALPVFGNRTSDAGIETDFTNALALEFNRQGGGLRVVAPPADLTLSGSIDEEYLEGVAYSREVIAVERRVRLRMSARLRNASGQVLWEDPNIRDNEVYAVSDDPLVTEENRRAAIRRIADRTAFQIHNRALEGF